MGVGAAEGKRGQAESRDSIVTPAGLNLEALRNLLVHSGVDVHGNFVATSLAGGRSNLTYKVSDERLAWVVRRPPPGGLTPSAHDVAREFRMIKALEHTPVPTASPVALDAEGTVMGTPVSVVSFVPGEVIRARKDLTDLGDAQLHRIIADLVNCLVDLHRVNYEEVGLETFAKPTGFVERQVALWSRQWTRVAAHDSSDIARLSGLLADRVPRSESAAILHGDFRLDNAIISLHGAPTVRAIVDWEMATVGDPLTDVALMCVYRSHALDLVLGVEAAWSSTRLPDPDTLAEQYARASGRDLGDWGFYLAMGYFKLAVIAEGIAHRARVVFGDRPQEGISAALAVPILAAAGLTALKA